MFRTNRGCDADGFGPSGVGRPAVNHVCVKPNQRVDTCRQNIDQSYSLCLKPKFETVPKQLFHWLATHPGVGVFLVFGDKRQNQWLVLRPALQVKVAGVLFSGRKQMVART